MKQYFKKGVWYLECSKCNCTIEDEDIYCCQCGHKLDRSPIDEPYQPKFPVGTKVIPISKTAQGRVRGLKKSAAWLKALASGQTYLVVERVPLDGDYPEYLCDGDYFVEDDLIFYDHALGLL